MNTRAVWSVNKKSNEAQGWLAMDLVVAQAVAAANRDGVEHYRPFTKEGQRRSGLSYEKWLAWASPLGSRGVAITRMASGAELFSVAA